MGCDNTWNILFSWLSHKNELCIFFVPDLGMNRQYSPEVLAALQSVQFIAQHIKDEDKDNEVSKKKIIH